MNKGGAGKPPVGFQNQFHVPDTCTEGSSSTSHSRTLLLFSSLSPCLFASSCYQNLCSLKWLCLSACVLSALTSHGPTSSRSHYGVHPCLPGRWGLSSGGWSTKPCPADVGSPAGVGRAELHTAAMNQTCWVSQEEHLDAGDRSGEERGLKSGGAQEHIS